MSHLLIPYRPEFLCKTRVKKGSRYFKPRLEQAYCSMLRLPRHSAINLPYHMKVIIGERIKYGLSAL